jgi:hypothetical protein
MGEPFTFIDNEIPMNEGSPHALDRPIYPGVPYDSIPVGKI